MDRVAGFAARTASAAQAPGRFGRKIMFSPPPNGLLASFAPNAIAEELIERVDRAWCAYPAAPR